MSMRIISRASKPARKLPQRSLPCSIACWTICPVTEKQLFTVDQIAEALGKPGEREAIFRILQHLAANPDHAIAVAQGATIFEARYSA